MRTLNLAAFILASCGLQSQTPPALEWQDCYGGSATEAAWQHLALSNGESLLVGYTNSNDGDVAGFNGGSYDIWVVRLNDVGGIIWQRCLGGTGTDVPGAALELPDGNIVVVGTTNSTNGQVTGNHGSNDGWVIGLDSSGNIEWQHCFGGSNGDGFYDALALPNGDIIAFGASRSSDGDVTLNLGGEDAWAVRFTSQGGLLWSRTYGSSAFDVFYSCSRLLAGEIIALGYASANNGDVTGNHGQEDLWAVLLQEDGDLIWQRCYGGSAYEIGRDVSASADGGAVLLGYTESSDGDVVGQHGAGDAWVVRINSAGEATWQRPLGGSDLDAARKVHVLSDNRMQIAGRTFSSDGDVAEVPLADDCWILQLFGDGSIEWQTLIGGSGGDSGIDLYPDSDGSLLVFGTTSSNDFDVSGNHGGSDAWLARLTPFSAIAEADKVQSVWIYPSPTADALHLRNSDKWAPEFTYSVFDAIGRLALKGTSTTKMGEASIDVSTLPHGSYWLVAQTAYGLVHGQFVKGR